MGSSRTSPAWELVDLSEISVDFILDLLGLLIPLAADSGNLAR
jgi:hypothetical protein